ncbi:MAG: glycosyltransferase family 4 protein [Rugosibacter sp.]|nr:glycosyltransferase family 4 protein [Rugosibacter sp.]
MRLALVRQKYTPYGGAERFVARALESLAARGVDVEIIARQWTDGPAPGRCVDPFYLGRTWRDWGFARAVQKIIAAGDYDLVQSHERIPGCHIYRAGDGVHATWLELRGAPAPFAPWHRYTLAAERALFGHPNLRAVICNSRMVRDDIARRFGVAAEKLHVIYNGVDLEYFHPRLRETHRQALREKLGAGGTAPVVLFVGSGYARKGLPTLLAAFADMAQRQAELWVVGRDKNEAGMQALAQRLGIAARVRFFGAQQDVRPFYGAADVFALPTRYDPFPNAALEALACGLPLLTTATCGAAERVSVANGAVIAAGDVVALAVQLDALCAPDRAASMREAARQSVLDLDLERMAQRLSALYDLLLQPPR